MLEQIQGVSKISSTQQPNQFSVLALPLLPHLTATHVKS